MAQLTHYTGPLTASYSLIVRSTVDTCQHRHSKMHCGCSLADAWELQSCISLASSLGCCQNSPIRLVQHSFIQMLRTQYVRPASIPQHIAISIIPRKPPCQELSVFISANPHRMATSLATCQFLIAVEGSVARLLQAFSSWRGYEMTETAI